MREWEMGFSPFAEIDGNIYTGQCSIVGRNKGLRRGHPSILVLS